MLPAALVLAFLVLESSAQPLRSRSSHSSGGGWTYHSEGHSFNPDASYIHSHRERHHGGGGGGSASQGVAILIIVLIIAAITVRKYLDYRHCLAEAREPTFELRSQLLDDPLSHEEYASEGAATAASAEPARPLPSGIWRGYYTFEGDRHDVCEFHLTFAADSGRVTGVGVDDVGKYDIAGRFHGKRLAFSKTYQAESENVDGEVHEDNHGHTVEYRGQLGASLGEGVRGTWHIRSEIGSHDGNFHLWPSMEGWTDSASSSEQDSQQVFEESECVVCYDRAIATCLRPCGHVALCEVCATQLSPRRCPLCRAGISAIVSRRPGEAL